MTICAYCGHYGIDHDAAYWRCVVCLREHPRDKHQFVAKKGT